jgi:hypothetical protein
MFEPYKRRPRDVRVTVHFSAESGHTRFKQSYKLTGETCPKLPSLFKSVLAQLKNKLREAFGAEQQVALSQSYVICKAPSAMDTPKAIMVHFRGFDEQLRKAQSRSRVDCGSRLGEDVGSLSRGDYRPAVETET